MRPGLDHGDLGAELAEGDAELEADIARADHDQLLGQLVQRQRLGGGNHRAAEFEEGQFDRHRAIGQDHVLGGDRDGAVVGFNRCSSWRR